MEEMAADLSKKIEADRARVSGFLDNLISAIEGTNDSLTIIGSADSVAKIAEALTRQNHLMVEAMKVLGKKSPKGKVDADSAYKEIGLPFGEDDPLGDGQN